MTRWLIAILFGLTWWTIPARADDNRPLSITVIQESPETFRVRWKVPAVIEARHLPEISQAECLEAGPRRRSSDALGHWAEVAWHCPSGIADKAIKIIYPKANPNLATIARFHPADKDQPQTVLMLPHETVLTFAAPGRESGTFRDFIVLGIEHIWIGIDHLLFVAGLVFIARTPRRVLTTVTGFTIAHSITLALSTLDFVRLPIATVEAVIALSIVFLAVEIVKGRRETLTWRRPVVVASAFGLLHGFGFSAALREIGLPQGSFVSSLLAFNCGIEIGQMIFACALLTLFWLFDQIPWKVNKPFPAAKYGGYIIGTTSCFWMFERLTG